MDRIPARTIGVLSGIIPNYYTHDGINTLFLYAGAPEEVPTGSKPAKVQEWLRQTNLLNAEPLRVLGVILDDFMSKEIDATPSPWGGPTTADERAEALKADQQKIRTALAADGLAVARGGHLTKAGTSATLSLDENVRKHGLAGIDVEIQRALAQVESDPKAAAHYAANVLEATCKAYLDHHKVAYKQTATLSDLWQLTANQMGLRPQDWDDKDLKQIGSGLHSIVGGIMHLRNKKSGAHGQSGEQVRTVRFKPRHARLAIHSAHTISAYIVELMDAP